MQKEFDLKTFKKSASNVSGFLKDKNVDISHVTLYNALSLFLGYKNWNTLNDILSKPVAKEIIHPEIESNVIDNKDNLIFKNRVKAFIDFVVENYEDHYSSIILQPERSDSDKIKIEDILKAATKMLNHDSDSLDIYEATGNKYERQSNFECNDSMLDEKIFTIKIAQKGTALFPYLDVLLYVFATENKWFENYIMGKCRYSYAYDEKYQKQVIKLNLPIDNFMDKEFDDQLIKLKSFLDYFSSTFAEIRLTVEKSDIGVCVSQSSSNMVNIKGFKTSDMSDSVESSVSLSGGAVMRNRSVRF